MSNDYLSLAVSSVQRLHPYTPGKPIEELQRETGIPAEQIIKLASNETSMPPSTRVIEAIQFELGNLTRYPDDNGYRLKHKLHERFGVDVDGITLGNGSNSLLTLIAQVFLAPGRNAVFSQYAFSAYASATISTGAEGREVPAQEWGHDLDAMARAVDANTRIVFITNPNNPTGTWFDREALESFLDKVPKSTLVVLDEAYIEYADDPELPDGLKYLQHHANLIVCRTFCKAYGLAGLRIGYAASSKHIAQILHRVRQPFNVNCLAQAAACAALDDEEHLSLGLRSNRLGLALLHSGLSQLGLSWIPSKTNFVTVDLERPARPIYESLLRAGIIVRPLSSYGMPNHLRISVGTETEIARFLSTLHQIVSKRTPDADQRTL
ncbi:histidinol-phosphate aminotransferase [Cupriavidus sp. YR651]|uniref:histidinol-phosphate transaminase n=1 Tax=Cupriavidus sp. YR651 TaxID=1855315 RepID=UPI000891762E|nr:histidinol-phosphate transaminase [Cupriavidus sp. YR651]SDD96045.1 histidinol-phosphate aminotransferase [Cupriavidus sp. YR651]